MTTTNAIDSNQVIQRVREELSTGNPKGVNDLVSQLDPRDYEDFVLEYLNEHLEAFGLTLLTHKNQWQMRYVEEYERAKLSGIEKIENYVMGGNATFTLRNTTTKNRYTYKVRKPRKRITDEDGNNKMEVQDYYEVFVLRLSDNAANSSYAKLGEIIRDDEGDLFWNTSEKCVATKGFTWLWKQIQAKKELPDHAEVWHEGTCGRCGRKLTVPESIADGIGPKCVVYRRDMFGATTTQANRGFKRMHKD